MKIPEFSDLYLRWMAAKRDYPGMGHTFTEPDWPDLAEYPTLENLINRELWWKYEKKRVVADFHRPVA